MLSTLSLDIEMMNGDDDKVIRATALRLFVKSSKGQKIYNGGQELVFGFLCLYFVFGVLKTSETL